MSDVTLYISKDSSAVSVGADAVAGAIAAEAARRGIALSLTRTGSRGALWLEPLVEIDVAGVRHAYGPVKVAEVAGLFAADFLSGGAHPLAQGAVDAIPYFARQQRITFARCGTIAPTDLAAYQAAGGLAGLSRAKAMATTDIIDAVMRSGLRGRGGAGFPTGTKWKTAADAPGREKYICCNADEGDSGTFADRLLMEGDPFALIEGMAIAARAIGAAEGYIYIRSEYPAAAETMRAAISLWDRAGHSDGLLEGRAERFRLHVRVGAGAYICGEESAMLESLEGRRGMVRAKPPIPALSGLFGKPTVVNNVLTLASVPAILEKGAAYYSGFGAGRSRGTQAFQLAGNVARGGLVEVPFGITVRDLIDSFGGGTRSGRPVRAVQAGGPLGSYLTPEQFDLTCDYETFAEAGAMLGHGGLVVFDDTVDMGAQARFAMEFCAIESCGKCTPCRIGAVRGMETIDKILAGDEPAANTALLEDLCELMTDGSLCAMGGLTPQPVLSALKGFPEDFDPARRQRLARRTADASAH